MTILELFRGTILFTTYSTSTHSLIVYVGPYSLQLCCYAASLSIFNFCIAGPYANYFFILTNFVVAFLVAMWDHTHCNFNNRNYAVEFCNLWAVYYCVCCRTTCNSFTIVFIAVVGFTLDCGTIHNHKVINYYKSQQ